MLPPDSFFRCKQSMQFYFSLKSMRILVGIYPTFDTSISYTKSKASCVVKFLALQFHSLTIIHERRKTAQFSKKCLQDYTKCSILF